MSQNSGFPPISKSNAEILILGSMPGVKSLQEIQYYAHPRNVFWPIIIKLLNAKEELSYRQRKQLLIDNKIALWDVLKSCYREGSLDSNIDHSTIRVNDFNKFLKKHPIVKTICFNGGEAEKLFNRHVKKNLTNQKINYIKLPSTSPAHAAVKFEEKLSKWKIIKDLL